MGSSVLMGGICYSIPHNLNLRSRYRSNLCKLGGRNSLMMSLQSATATATTATLPSRVAPWLMLPPHFEGGDMFYNFYRLDEGLVKSVKKKREDSDQEPPDDAKLVGSSHGWLALFDENSNRVFLSNPISGRHIKLPPIDTLPDPHINLLGGRGSVSRVILSCSPGEDECRAMMSFGPEGRLAFCVPGVSTEWTPVGDLYNTISVSTKFRRAYEDFVYSGRKKLFFCITEHNTEWEGWNLSDPLRPRIDWNIPQSPRFCMSWPELPVYPWYPNYPWPEHEEEFEHIKNKCWHLKYLVYAEHSDQLYQVVRHVAPRMRPDGSAAPRIRFFGEYECRWDYRYPYKTVDFDVYKIDREQRKLSYMEGSLEGMTFFVGKNHSFAVPGDEFPELKSNSIYFTDEDRLIMPEWVVLTNFGGHDNGVCDYRDKAFSSCCTYCPYEYERITRIVPPPMWFTPKLMA